MRLFGTEPRVLAVATVVCIAVLLPHTVSATVIGVNSAFFGAGSTLTTFAGLADGTEVDGLVTDGLTFDYSLGAGDVVIDGGPGVTNNVSPPNIVSVGNPTGVLSVLLPSYSSAFGYGYAVVAPTLANATTIALYDGATPLGSLSYNAVPDPGFAGGFAGIASTIPFNIVQITFTSAEVTAFAVDNIRTDTAAVSAVPEPASLTLLGLGLAGMAGRRWRQRKRT